VRIGVLKRVFAVANVGTAPLPALVSVAAAGSSPVVKSVAAVDFAPAGGGRSGRRELDRRRGCRRRRRAGGSPMFESVAATDRAPALVAVAAAGGSPMLSTVAAVDCAPALMAFCGVDGPTRARWRGAGGTRAAAHQGRIGVVGVPASADL